MSRTNEALPRRAPNGPRPSDLAERVQGEAERVLTERVDMEAQLGRMRWIGIALTACYAAGAVVCLATALWLWLGIEVRTEMAVLDTLERADLAEHRARRAGR